MVDTGVDCPRLVLAGDNDYGDVVRKRCSYAGNQVGCTGPDGGANSPTGGAMRAAQSMVEPNEKPPKRKLLKKLIEASSGLLGISHHPLRGANQPGMDGLEFGSERFIRDPHSAIRRSLTCLDDAGSEPIESPRRF